MNLREELFENRDEKFKEFHIKLIPDCDPDRVIGVRLPVQRRIAKRAVKENAENELYYFEEIMVKGFTIGYKKNTIEGYLSELREFVPLIDNWAVCDSTCATYKFALKYQSEVWEFIQSYFDGGEYEIRFAVVMLMDYFLNDDYIDRSLNILKSIRSEYYYVNMAISWALSYAYVSYRDKTLKILDNKELTPWVHNKTIQKICESYRAQKEDKQYLKSIKIKAVKGRTD